MVGLVKAIVGGRMLRRSTARSIAWNYAGYIYQIAINFGLTAYVVRYIDVAEYGLLLFVMSLSNTLYLMDMGISSVLVQAYVAAAESREKDRLNNLISTTFIALTALGSIGVLIFAGIAASLPGPFKIPHPYLHEAALIFIIGALVIQVGLPSIALEQIYQASERFDRINQIQLVTSTVQIVLSVLVLMTGFRIVALALVQLAAALLRLLFFIVALRTSVPQARLNLTRFKWDLLKPLISLSKWAFLNNLSASLFEMLTWTILGAFGSMSEAAMFGLASKAPKQLWNLVDKGANVTLPSLSKAAVENDINTLQQTYLKSQKLVLGAVLPFIVLGCFFAKPIIQVWAGSEYTRAALVMQWLLLAALSHAFTYSSDLLLYACGQVKKAAWIASWAGLASVAGALLLVSRYGAVGMAAGMAVTQLVINCGWFTTAACKLSQTSPWTLLRVVLDGIFWPLVALAAEMAFIWSISRYLSPLWLVLSALICGCTYIGLWGARTALPLYRSQTEIAA